ncbi:MAG: hypothetical protein AABY46_01045 [Nitrospirota bacterium]
MTESTRVATDPFPGGVDVKIAISRDAVGLEIEVKHVRSAENTTQWTATDAVEISLKAFDQAVAGLKQRGYEPGPFAKKPT